MKNILKHSLIAVMLVLVAFSCKKDDNDSVEPITPIYEVSNVENISLPENLIDIFQKLLDHSSIGSSIDSIIGMIYDDVPYFITPAQLFGTLREHWGDGMSTGVMKYQSKDVFGNPATLSGRIYIKNTTDKKLKGIIIANHFTICSDDECPSKKCLEPESILVPFGYAMVMADYIGYGSTVDMEHPYLNWEATATASIDAYFAMKQYLEDNGYKVGDERYNVGYSQGGEATMSVLRMVTEDYSDQIHFNKSFVGAGPHSIEATYDDVIGNDFTGIPMAMPMIVNGMNTSYNLGLNLDDVFIGEMHDNYKKVLSKKHSSLYLSLLFKDHEASKIFTPSFLDKNDPMTAKFIEAARKNELVGTWTPKAGEDIYLFHSMEDDMVPFVNSELMGVALENTDCKLEEVFGRFGTHIQGMAIFMLSMSGYFAQAD
ncbi:MAG: lipase family protein [Bacteroidales bacterium]|nr:lipase family protein [Bacteroidales bacterium]